MTQGAIIVQSPFEPSFTNKRRPRKDVGARAGLLPLSGRNRDRSTRASLELIADLHALINAGLIEQVTDGEVIRYAEADRDDPTRRPFRGPRPEAA
jgi:hypothetical protein